MATLQTIGGMHDMSRQASDASQMRKAQSDCHAQGSACFGASGVAGQATPTDKPQLEEWLHNMLNTQFFTSCQAHKEHKKNEATYFCTDCGVSSRALCAHCLPQHVGHRMIQIRRYVYCDVVRASDMSTHVDITGVQTYIINQAKVMFLNQRPQSKIGRPGAPDSCQTCARTLREGCSYCSLACKVEALEAIGKLRMPAAGNCADATLSDSESEGWPIQPRSYQKLYEQEVNSLALQVQDGVSGDSSSSQQLWGEHRQHVHVGATAAWLRRNSDDSTSSGSHYSRRKQFSPRRSPLL